ncbi:hypothetical protein PsorP6_006091 [Peronosclerospora sorghi]|uniref:Uncharacterized protein n=1 Tax=Peronosclerospora sorghi TaxID=230839 RepID=A0ACC0W3Z7_9STRA|nr:hypothetical protein PsorP6_006091 [Peronosclerospora sorghi]
MKGDVLKAVVFDAQIGTGMASSPSVVVVVIDRGRSTLSFFYVTFFRERIQSHWLVEDASEATEFHQID